MNEDITGQKFGFLTAICKTDRQANDSVIWKFLCECGREDCLKYVEIPRKNVTRNRKMITCGAGKNHSDNGPAISRLRNNTTQSNNSLGERGITKKKNGKYLARISFNNKRIGKCFDTLEEAIAWREQKESELKEYYRL